MRVEETDSPDAFRVSGRGELHLAITVEMMRREGFEFALSRPQVILKEIDGQTCEPIEELVIDVPEVAMGTVIEKLGQRKAEMTNMTNHGSGRVKIEFKIPTRGLFGYRNEFLTDTKGEGLLYHVFHGYEPFRGEVTGRGRGALVCKEAGETTAHSLERLEERRLAAPRRRAVVVGLPHCPSPEIPLRLKNRLGTQRCFRDKRWLGTGKWIAQWRLRPEGPAGGGNAAVYA